jgi:hypothetical protein
VSEREREKRERKKRVDNGFGYEKWLQGGCIGLALL